MWGSCGRGEGSGQVWTSRRAASEKHWELAIQTHGPLWFAFFLKNFPIHALLCGSEESRRQGPLGLEAGKAEAACGEMAGYESSQARGPGVPGLGGEGRRGGEGVARLCPVLMVAKQDHLMKDSGWQIQRGREEGPGGAQELFLPAAPT